MKCLTIELRISFSYECYLTLCGQNTCYYMQASRSHPCRKPKCHRNPPAGFSAQLPAPPPPLLTGRKTLSRTLSAGPYSTDKEHCPKQPSGTDGTTSPPAADRPVSEPALFRVKITDRLLAVRMQRLGDRTGRGGVFEQFALFGFVRRREMHVDNDLADAARIGRHHLGYAQAGTVHVNAVRIGRDTHQRHHAAAERGGHQVGRRERFAFAVVVGRCVGHDLRARLCFEHGGSTGSATKVASVRSPPM